MCLNRESEKYFTVNAFYTFECQINIDCHECQLNFEVMNPTVSGPQNILFPSVSVNKC